MFGNMIAVEHFDWFKEREKKGLSNNFLVSIEAAKSICIHSWVKFDRLTKAAVVAQIKEATSKDRMIAVSYHKDGEHKDCFELYVSLGRAIELIEDESLFVFKFRVLSKSVTDEYKMLCA